MGLTIDFGMGFVCFDAASKVSVRHPFIRNKNCSRGKEFLSVGGCSLCDETNHDASAPLPFRSSAAAYLFCSVCILAHISLF